jgi:hypothetical protein
MKKIIAMVVLSLFVMVSMPTVAAAGATKGQKLFKKKFRKKCKFSGVKFSRHHTQAEWEEIYDDGNKIKPSWWEHVYEFSVKYAKDGVVPKC